MAGDVTPGNDIRKDVNCVLLFLYFYLLVNHGRVHSIHSSINRAVDMVMRTGREIWNANSDHKLGFFLFSLRRFGRLPPSPLI